MQYEFCWWNDQLNSLKHPGRPEYIFYIKSQTKDMPHKSIPVHIIPLMLETIKIHLYSGDIYVHIVALNKPSTGV